VTAQASVQLVGGAPFMSDADLSEALAAAGVPAATAQAILDANAVARLAALRGALAVIALGALLGLFFTRRVPTVPPGEPSSVSP
jgi:hypothetical protein